MDVPVIVDFSRTKLFHKKILSQGRTPGAPEIAGAKSAVFIVILEYSGASGA